MSFSSGLGVVHRQRELLAAGRADEDEPEIDRARAERNGDRLLPVDAAFAELEVGERLEPCDRLGAVGIVRTDLTQDAVDAGTHEDSLAPSA